MGVCTHDKIGRMVAMNVKGKSTDELLEIIYWFYDRAAYCRACGERQNPEDYSFFDLASDELDRRGIGTPLPLGLQDKIKVI